MCVTDFFWAVVPDSLLFGTCGEAIPAGLYLVINSDAKSPLVALSSFPVLTVFNKESRRAEGLASI